MPKWLPVSDFLLPLFGEISPHCYHLLKNILILAFKRYIDDKIKTKKRSSLGTPFLYMSVNPRFVCYEFRNELSICFVGAGSIAIRSVSIISIRLMRNNRLSYVRAKSALCVSKV